jgi:LPS export ABC transporter protein LptC
MTAAVRIAVLSAALVAVAACGNKGSTPPTLAQASLADSAEQVMLGVRTLLTNQGVMRGELFADSAYVFDNSTRFELRKVRATFNTPSGAKDGVMSADRGRYSTSQQVLEGFGHATVTTTSGRKLSSPHLRYNQAANEVSSDSAFTAVQQDGSVVSGIGFRADPQLNHVTILKGTSGRSTFSLPTQ